MMVGKRGKGRGQGRIGHHHLWADTAACIMFYYNVTWCILSGNKLHNNF